jgi:hypothetical protein
VSAIEVKLVASGCDSGAELGDEALQAGVGVRQRGHDRRQVGDELGQRRERAVDGVAASGERLPEVVEVAVDVVAGLFVERREEVVELGSDGARAGADRRPVGKFPGGHPLDELDVLQAERRARADLDRRVGRDRRRGRVER